MGYWEDRQARTQAALTKKNIEQVERQLGKYYFETQRKVIGQFQSTYNKILSSKAEGREPTPADLYKLDTYWKMQAQLAEELVKMGNAQALVLNHAFILEYKQIYEATALKDNLFFGEIDTDAAQAMINHIWCADGLNWSERIWKNTNELKWALNDELLQCLVAGRNPDYLKERLMAQFGASYNRADALVRTEMAHIQTQAAQQRYIDAGVEYVQVWADKDERQCDICGELHQKMYKVGEKLPIPAHPRCRCCIVPVV